METVTANSEADIWMRTIQPERGDLSRDAAQFILQLKLANEDLRRSDELASKAVAGEMSATEEVEIENYRRAGRLLELMQSKARLSLRLAGSAG